MCFGGKSKSSPQTTPAPTPPTQFAYVNADQSNSQQRQAAVMSSTAQNNPASFGSELGAGGGAATGVNNTGGVV